MTPAHELDWSIFALQGLIVGYLGLLGYYIWLIVQLHKSGYYGSSKDKRK
jgi:hypothetical protein